MSFKIDMLRKTKGLSQVQLAKNCGVTQQCISKIESGKSIPSLELAISIAKELNCSIDDLYNHSESRSPST